MSFIPNLIIPLLKLFEMTYKAQISSNDKSDGTPDSVSVSKNILIKH